jgi:hypothetical protein
MAIYDGVTTIEEVVRETIMEEEYAADGKKPPLRGRLLES